MDALEKKCKKCGTKFRITPIELRFMASQQIKPAELCRSCAVGNKAAPKSALSSAK